MPLLLFILMVFVSIVMLNALIAIMGDSAGGNLATALVVATIELKVNSTKVLRSILKYE